LDRDAPLDEDMGVLKNPPFKRAFYGKSNLGQGHPPGKDKAVLRNPSFKSAFWGKSDLKQVRPS